MNPLGQLAGNAIAQRFMKVVVYGLCFVISYGDACVSNASVVVIGINAVSFLAAGYHLVLFTYAVSRAVIRWILTSNFFMAMTHATRYLRDPMLR